MVAIVSELGLQRQQQQLVLQILLPSAGKVVQQSVQNIYPAATAATIGTVSTRG